jgi:hypothetical protein
MNNWQDIASWLDAPEAALSTRCEAGAADRSGAFV